MDCGRCKDCQWWRCEDSEFGECELAQSCSGVPKYPHTKAAAHDVEGYHASLYTAPDFGCVQFEPRKQEAA